MRVLIVGVSTRAMAESARRAGREIVTIDYFGDMDQKQLCENHSLREHGLRYSAAAFTELARELSYDALVYAGGLENHPAVVAQLCRGRALLGNAPETLAAVRNPERLFAVLADSGFGVPSIVVHGGRLPIGGRWLSKPLHSGGGNGIRAWRRGRVPAGHILEERIDGVPGSASFVADGRRSALLGVTRELHGRRRFRYDGNIFPLDVPSETVDEIRRIADLLTRAFGLRGVNNFDFVLRGARPVVVEVNPRCSASMELIEWATGQSIFDVHLAGCRGELAGSREPSASYWGKRIVHARATTRLGDTHTWLERGIRDVPHPGDSINRGEPICTVLAPGATPEACERRLSEEARVIYQLTFDGSPAYTDRM